MEFFEFTLWFDKVDDVPLVVGHLKANIANLLTPAVQISHWHND
jgi:hypothetical protein